MNSNSKIINILVILAIVIICLVIYKRKVSTFNNPIYQTLSSTEKNTILNKYLNFNNLDPILTNEVVIKRLKDSTQLVIQNLTDTQTLLDFHYQKNFGVKNSELEYQLRDLENTNSIMSGMLVSHGQSTSPRNSKYGFIIKVSKEHFKSENNIAEFSIDFTSSRQEQLNNLHKIKEVVESKNYQNQDRKTVNLFTQYNAPADIQPYFTTGSHGKDIKTVIRFLDATNIDYLRNFPEGRFNILDNNLTPVLTYCKLDVPYCGVNLKPQGNIKGRDKYVTGKFNNMVGEYTVVDSQEYSNYKADRSNKQEEEKRKTGEVEIENLKAKKPTYDMLTNNQRIMVKEYDTQFYQELVNKKKEELLAREDQDYGDIDIKFISENNLENDFNMFVGGYSQGLIEQTQERYRNMEEHFTDTVTTQEDSSNLGFSGEKYIQYQEYDECMSKENRDKNTEKMVSGLHSPILEDNLMILKDKNIFDKIKEKMGFKCRKHHKEKDERYFYGGIDFDGGTKCYGEANACKMFPTEKDCLDLEKELNKVDGFTGSNTDSNIIEHFNSPFQAEKDTIYRLSFMSGGKKYYLKKGLDVYRQRREYTGNCGNPPYITGDCSPIDRFIFGHTENVNEAIGFGYEPKHPKLSSRLWHNSPSQCMFFLHNKTKYHFIYQGAAQHVIYPDGSDKKHYYVFAPNHLPVSCTSMIQIGSTPEYYFTGRPNEYYGYTLPYQILYRYFDRNKATKFTIEKDEFKTKIYQDDLDNNKIQEYVEFEEEEKYDSRDTTQDCHNYKIFKELNNTINETNNGYITRQIRIHKNFEISFDMKYKTKYPVTYYTIIDLVLPPKYRANRTDSYIMKHSKKADYKIILDLSKVFTINTHGRNSSSISLRARTKETSLFIPEGNTTKEKYLILEGRERALLGKPNYHSHIWGGLVGNDNPTLAPGKDYHFKIVCFRDKLEFYIDGEKIAYKPSLEKNRQVYDSVALRSHKNNQYFDIENFKYVNLDNPNEVIGCATTDFIEQARKNLAESADDELTQIQQEKILAQTDINESKQDLKTTVDTVKQEVKSLNMEQQQQKNLQNKELLQIENEKKYKETLEKMRQRELASSEQKNLSDKIAGLNKLVTYDAFDSSQPGYIGAELEENYQKYNFLNCIPYERKDITCKHVTKNLKFDMETKQLKTENQTLVDIITVDEAQESNIPEVLQSHEVLSFNSKQKEFLKDVKNLDDSALASYINFEMNKPIDYLIEPCYEEYKNINSNIIFDGFKIKFRMVNIIDSKNSVPGFTETYYTTLQIIKNNTPDGYILDNTGTPVRIEAEDYIYLYLNNSGDNRKTQKLHIEIYKNNVLKNSNTLNIYNLEGTYGDNITFFLQTNNQHIFDKILFAEQLGNIVLPYDPYISVKVE